MRPWHHQWIAKHLYECYIYRYALQFKQIDNNASLNVSLKPLTLGRIGLIDEGVSN
jgi:hypothetical protein